MIRHRIQAVMLDEQPTGTARVPVWVAAEYDKANPYAVKFVFAAKTPVEWTFARDLLANGIVGSDGYRDVRIESCGRVVDVILSSPAGEAFFEFPRNHLVDFLDATERAVPYGQESERYGDGWDADAEWLAVMAG